MRRLEKPSKAKKAWSNSEQTVENSVESTGNKGNWEKITEYYNHVWENSEAGE